MLSKSTFIKEDKKKNLLDYEIHNSHMLILLLNIQLFYFNGIILFMISHLM